MRIGALGESATFIYSKDTQRVRTAGRDDNDGDDDDDDDGDGGVKKFHPEKLHVPLSLSLSLWKSKISRLRMEEERRKVAFYQD